MSEQQPQVSKLAGALVEHQQAFKAMTTGERQWVIEKTVSAIGIFAEAVRKYLNGATTEAKKLLELLFVFQAGAVKEFSVAKKFVEGETVDGVSIAWLGDNFKKNHLPKIERTVAGADLKVHKLLEEATDLSKEGRPGILPELNGWHETTHAHFFQLLAHKQKKEDFTRLVGYIVDNKGVLSAVCADWHPACHGWDVGARSVAGPRGWGAGRQVVSR